MNITIILNEIETIDTAQMEGGFTAEYLRRKYWYSTVPMSGEPKIISRIIPWKDRQEPVISIVKRIINPHTLEPFGMLIIDINYKRLKDTARKVTLGKTGFLYILDEQGHYVYHPDRNKIGEKLQDFDFEKIKETNSGSFIVRNEQKQLIIFNTSSMLKWKLVTSVPYYELTEGINYIGRTIVLTIAFTLLAAYILGVGFALSLVRPVRELQRYMKRVEVGDFSGKVSVDSRDEIGMLAQGFNKMVRRLSALLDEIYYSKLKETQMILRQKETELKVLQSQLNPHFLYNSLETIRGMALESGKDEIATMALSLAKLLRYHLRNTASTVTLRQEISFCEIYLRIQKYRFEEKLDYELVIPDWAEEQNIAKFSLQPIIENCMVHGLEPHMEKMTVKVEVIRETETTFFVQISDTGPGMAEETLARLRRDLKMKDITDGGSHIGIVNVHRRNTYIFGEAFGVHIDSVVGKGTVIRIRLPMNGEDCSEERGECNDAHRFTGR